MKTISNNQLRIWLNRGGRSTYKNVESPEEAEMLIRKAIKKDLKDSSIITNAFGLEVYEDNGDGFEWCEWYCPSGEYEGSDIMQIIDEKDEANQ